MTRRWPMLILSAAMAVPTAALAQQKPAPLPGARSRSFLKAPQAGAPTPGTRDSQVFRSGDTLPEPSEIEPAASGVPLPTGPIEPFLLTKAAGPFMVLAHTFRGDNAVRQAQALAMELRAEYKLPSYVFFLKLKPGNSNIQGVPPTAPRQVNAPKTTPPESYRVVDEAAVLIGDCKTIEEADTLRDRVKKLKPAALGNSRSVFHWRDGKGLSRALITTNPLLPAQDLYPGRPIDGNGFPDRTGQVGAPHIMNGAEIDPEILRSQFVAPVDPLIEQMNEGKNSVYNCPGRFTLVVLEFSGRASFNEKDPVFSLPDALKKSPLKTAHDDAEELAAQLAKHPTVRAMGLHAYVYHDRTSSKVTLGSFNDPDDREIARVREAALTIVVEVEKDGKKAGQYLAPAPNVAEVPRH